MNSQQILDLYTWESGTCFQHLDAGVVETTVVQELHTRLGPVEGIRACSACILAMEARRRSMAAEAGVAYEPGHAGDPL